MKILITILLFFIAVISNAATYYFSTTDGNDSRTSTQAQNSTTPWQTISKLNSFFSSLAAGDIIRFKRGDTFYGAIVSNKNGTLANKITLTSYGSGAKPIITGLTTVSSWTNLGGGIYESNAIGSGSSVNMVLIDGVAYAMGRTPNAGAANGGYLTYESHASSSITDNTNPFSSSYNGAQLITRNNHYVIEQHTISTISGNTINISGTFDATPTNDYGYFVQNSSLTLDQYGEWYYNPSTHKLSVYFGATPTATVKVATQNVLMLLENSYLVVDGLNLQGANTYGIFCENAGVQNLTVKNCNIDYSGIDGICLANRSDFVLDSSVINYSNSCGVNVGYQDVNPTITNTSVTNTGTFAGMLIEDARERIGDAIFSDNAALTCTNNVVTNTGYMGIFFNGSNNLVKNNYVDTFCTVLDDGGGIYTGNYFAVINTNNLIESNVVLHGIGAPYGVHESDPNYIPAEGIYLDDNTMNCTVLNNTSAYNSDMGIYCHNDSVFTLRGNVLFGNQAAQIGMQHDNIGSLDAMIGGVSKQNQLFPIRTYDPARILYLGSINNDMLTFMSSSDSNYYCRPFDTTNIIQTNWFSHATTNYHLSNWKTASGFDAHTVQTPVAISSDNDVLFLYNATNSSAINGLGGYAYKSVTGTDYSGSITLAPFSSVILLKGQLITGDTTYITSQIVHDTLVSTTIPEKIIHIGDSSVTLFDTSYNIFFIQQLYSTVDGSITTIIPLYDTIPAHDTTFITKTPAHDTTVIIITPEPEDAIYGMFTNTGGFLPFANQIHTAKIYSCNAVRDNTDENRNWKVKQAHDSSMIDLMTYNSPPCCNLNFFNTGPALTTALNTLSNFLRSNPNDKPELISFNNEEPNFGYWKGTPQDYLNWLNRAVDTCHKYGVPASNGGVLHTIYWYIRYVYQQEGKTDSVNLINSIFGIGNSTPAWGQAIIDWYKVEIPGLAASKIDYVNFHNYYNGLKPSEMEYINIYIRFLGSRTGKPVITTEGGVSSATEAELFEYYDRIKAEGVNIIVNMNGDGPLSDPHPDWFSDWINQ